jgi:hypothetical protein
MPAPTIYFAGGEDFDFTSVGTCTVDETATHFRSDFARCGLKGADGNSFWDTGNVMAVTSAWFHARVWMTVSSANPGSLASIIENACFKITDASAVVRLGLLFTPTGSSGGSGVTTNWDIGKFDNAGAFTKLGAIPSGIFTGSPAVPDEFDVQIIDYGATGTMNMYINRTLVYSFTGDLTTNGNTQINGAQFGGLGPSTNTATNKSAITYSEIIISDTDTRNLSLGTLTPAADGNTVNWDTGGVTNINEVTLDDGTINASGTANQVQQYTISAPPSGTYGVVALVIAAKAQAGSSGGPENLQLGLRTNGSDYWSASIPLSISLNREQAVFTENPDTPGNAFTLAQLAVAGFNVGMKSIT